MIAKTNSHIGNVQKSIYNLTIPLYDVVVNFFVLLNQTSPAGSKHISSIFRDRQF